MMQRAYGRAVLIVALVLVACSQPAGPAGAPAPAPAAAPAPASAPPAGGAAGAEWDRAVEAAKQEGRIVIAGPPGESWRAALSSFQNDYPGIAVDYNGFNSRDFFPRL